MTIPIEPEMTCEEFIDALAAYLEHDADDRARGSLDAHAAACLACGPLLADLRALRADAANLPVLTPSRDLWTGIVARIETPVVEIDRGGNGLRENGERRRRLSRTWAGLAAAGLIAVTATITHQLTKSAVAVREPAAAAAAAAAPGQVQQVSLASNGATEAAASYDAEIAALRATVRARRSSLDTATANLIERNLMVIDEAIAQCRAALARDPASQFLIASLADARATKMRLLRAATALPSRA